EQKKLVLPTLAAQAREKEFRRHEFYFSRERAAGSLQQAKRETPMQFARRQRQGRFVTSAEYGRLDQLLDARTQKEVSVVHRENVRALSRRSLPPRRFARETFLFSAAPASDELRQ